MLKEAKLIKKSRVAEVTLEWESGSLGWRVFHFHSLFYFEIVGIAKHFFILNVKV
jgi:hypothetical protein